MIEKAYMEDSSTNTNGSVSPLSMLTPALYYALKIIKTSLLRLPIEISGFGTYRPTNLFPTSLE